MELHALGILCGLGATSFATLTARSRRNQLAMLGGFVLAGVALWPNRFPDVSWAGTLVALAAATALMKPSWSVAAAACGGALAGLWISVLQLQGLPFAPALIVAAALPATSGFFAHYQPGFAPQVLREEALVIVVGLGLIVAMASEVSSGWRSAVELKAVPLGAETPALAGWMGLFVGACVVVGGLYSFWKRR